MPATIPTQEDLDVIKLAFDDHLKIVDAKLLEFEGLPEREKHDFADLERRVKILEDRLHPVTPPVVEDLPEDDEDSPSPKAHKKHK